MTKPDLNATAKERAKGMVELRDCVQKLIGQQMDGFISDDAIRRTQAELNELYDSFTAKYGLINSRANALASELRGVIFRNPENRQWETADEYLSGNVREKLRIAQSATTISPPI